MKRVDDQTLNLIAVHARAFRDALDQVDRRQLPFIYQRFPAGCCGAVSDVLNRFLRTRLPLDLITQVSGWRRNKDGDRFSHAWLAYEGLTIDVTADQFGLAPVIVCRGSEWHEGFADLEAHVFADDDWWRHHGAPLWRLVQGVEVPT